MKNILLGLMFVLLISFQGLNAAEDKSKDTCQTLLEQCKNFEPLANSKDCMSSCSSACHKETAKNLCSDLKDFNDVVAYYRLCTQTCSKPSPSKEKKISE